MAGRHAQATALEAATSAAATADVHAHTRRSDGVLEPAQLVAQAHAAGVRLFAIADHDNLAAYRELTAPGADRLPEGLELVPAVEINAITRGLELDLPEGELHILGIGVDPDDEAFERALSDQRDARRHRFAETVARLRAIGRPVDAHLDLSIVDGGGALGRPTVARALVDAGFANDVDDAFSRYLGHGQPAYVPRTGMGPVEAVRAIRAAGGLASVAHFAQAPQHLSLLRDLVREGLDGLETHHRSFDVETRASMSAAAALLGLVETGGTDYHGDTGDYAASHATLVMPDQLVEQLRVALRTRGRPARP